MNSLILKTLPESERPWAKAFLAIEDEGPQARLLKWLIADWIVLHVLLMWADHPRWLFGWIVAYIVLLFGSFTREISSGSQEWLFALPLNRAVIAKIRLWRFFAPLLAVTILSMISLATEAPRHLWGMVFDGPFVAPWAVVKPVWFDLPLLGLAVAGFLVALLLRVQQPRQMLARVTGLAALSGGSISLMMEMGLPYPFVLTAITIFLLTLASVCVFYSMKNYPRIEAQAS